MFDMFNIALPGNDFMNIFEIVASICTKMLFTVRSFDDNVHDQILDRPLVMFVGARDPDGQGRTQLIDQQMDFATQFASIRWIFTRFGTS